MPAEPSSPSAADGHSSGSGLDGLSVPALLQLLESLGIELRSADGKLQLTAPAGAMTHELQAEIRRRKPELIAHVAVQAGTRERTAPLSFAQQRLWLLDKFSPETAVYNIPQHWAIHGALQVEILQEAIRRLCDRHGSLRTRIEMRGREPMQVVQPSIDCTLSYSDLGETKGPDQALQEVRARLVEEGRRTFNLAAGPLIRFHLYRLAHEHYVLSYVAHHILADQTSLQIMQRDLGALYRAVLLNAAPALPALTTDYASIAEQERSQAGSQRQQGEMAYWRERLRDMPTMLTLPFAAEQKSAMNREGARISCTFDARLTASIRQTARAANTSAYFVMLTVFATLLSRYTGQQDLCIGTPVSTRKKREHEEIVGLFINMLPLRCEVDLSATTRQLLQQMRNTVLGDFEHGDVPFQKLVAELHPERATSSPFFQVLFALNPGFSETEAEAEEVDLRISKYDLTLQINEQRDTYTAHLEYRADLFSPDDIESFGRTLAALTESMISAPDTPVGLLDLLSAHDRENLVSWNQTGLAYDRTETLVSLFRRQAALHPHQPAILGAKGGATYAEVAKSSERIAAALRDAGVQREDFVAVCLDRTPQLIASILGVLMAGAAYLPLDPTYPEARLLYMLEDSGARVIVAAADALSDHLLAVQSGLVRLDPAKLGAIASDGAASIPSNSSVSVDPEDAAYLIYTSGSTGHPKGTVVRHRNVVALLAWAQSFFDAECLRVMLASTSICFDLSVFEVFLPLATGNTLLLVKDVLDLRNSADADSVTMINTVPSAMNTLLHAGLPGGVRAVCMAGEFLPTELVNRVYDAGVAQVFDLYGPTETTVYSTAAHRRRDAEPTIGRPIANTRVYVLDDRGMAVPPGATGELFLAGDGVSKGYLRRPEMTAERFVSMPAIEPQGRLYRTGDIVRHRADGSLEYHGRRDQQVKLRGHRIELGEVESVLREVTGASQVAVVVQAQATGEMLAGFVRLSDAPGDDQQRWTEEMRRKLPAYMVPTRLESLPSFPMTLNGKIDRRALQERVLNQEEPVVLYPENILEQWLANIFAAHLKVSNVSRSAHFFDDLGGNSLMAFEIFVDIERFTGAVLMLAVLFEAPTVEQLAQVLKRGRIRSMKHLRFHTAGSSEQVIYLVGKTDNLVDSMDAKGSRAMAIDISDSSQAAAALEEIILFEVARPALTLVASRADSGGMETFAAGLRRAAFSSVTTRILDEPGARRKS